MRAGARVTSFGKVLSLRSGNVRGLIGIWAKSFKGTALRPAAEPPVPEWQFIPRRRTRQIDRTRNRTRKASGGGVPQQDGIYGNIKRPRSGAGCKYQIAVHRRMRW